MNKFIRKNKWYFLCLSIFAVVGLFLLDVWKKPAATFFFSNNRSILADYFFRAMTRMGEAPVYFITAFIMGYFRRRYIWLVAAVGMTVLVVSTGLKAIFAIPRPAVWLQMNGLSDQVNFVEGVELHTGATSFPSGHTMAAFALCTIVAFILPYKRWGALSLFGIASCVGISRIYLVQHFWEDVFAGAFIGILIAVVIYLGMHRYLKKQE